MNQQILKSAKPIQVEEQGAYQYFCCSFSAKEGPAVLRLMANYQILLYINDELILARNEFGFPFYRFYDEVPLSASLKNGMNQVALKVACGKSREFAFEIEQNEEVICFSGMHWKTKVSDAYLETVPCNAVQAPHSTEEQFDARKENTDWFFAELDNENWEYAQEKSWAQIPGELKKHLPKMAAQETVFPKKMCALEAVQQAKGTRLTIQAPSGGILLYGAYFITEKACDCRIRSQHQRYGKPDLSIDGKVLEVDDTIHLSEGRHFLLVVKQDWLELLFEGANLQFFAEGLAKAPCKVACVTFQEYSLSFNWNEEGGIYQFWPELLKLLSAKNAEELPKDVRNRFIPGIEKPGLSLAEVKWDHYYQVSGSFFDDELAPTAERMPCADVKLNTTGADTLETESGTFTIEPLPNQMDVQFIVDFGTIYCGHVELDVTAAAGTVFDIQCFEMCDKTGAYYLYYDNGFRYIAKEGRQQYISPVRRGARYVSVTIRHMSGPVQVHGLSLLSVNYPVQKNGQFHSNDARLNRIYDICLHTASLCMLDTYVDCPTWEQGFWSGDCQITSKINLINFGEWVFDQHCIDLIGQTQKKEYGEWSKAKGLVHAFDTLEEPRLSSAKPDGFGYGGIPMWSFMLGFHIWEHYITGGNEEELKRNYEYLCNNLNVAKWWTNERGLFDMTGTYNLIDWGNNDLPPCGEVTSSNLFLAKNLEIAAQIAEILGKQDEAKAWMCWREELVQAINKYCFDEEKGAYVDTVRDEFAYPRFIGYCERAHLKTLSYSEYLSCGRISEQTNTIAVLCDCVPPNRMVSVMKLTCLLSDGCYICGAPRNRTIGKPTQQEAKDGIVRIGSPFFLHFSLNALCKENQHELALKVMRRDWGDMLDKGACTTFEMFDMSLDPRAKKNPWIGLPNWTRSASHAWSASPAIYLQQEILGVKPVEPGYRKFTIQPHLCDLTEVSGTVCTPYGMIEVSVRRDEENKVIISYRAPKECIFLENEKLIER